MQTSWSRTEIDPFSWTADSADRSADRIVGDGPIPTGLDRRSRDVAVALPPSDVGLGLTMVDRGEPLLVVAGDDHAAHVTQVADHMLDVAHQHREARGDFREPRLQPLVAGLHALEDPRRGRAGHVEQLLQLPLPEGGLIVERPDPVVIPVEVRSHLIRRAVQEAVKPADGERSEEHTSELQSLTISYAVFCLK